MVRLQCSRNSLEAEISRKTTFFIYLQRERGFKANQSTRSFAVQYILYQDVNLHYADFNLTLIPLCLFFILVTINIWIQAQLLLLFCA